MDEDKRHLNDKNKPEKRRIIVCPWKNTKEFHKVYECLYGEAANNESRASALSKIRIWSIRRSTLCPAAVLATAELLEVQLKDVDSYSPAVMQTLYAGAFTRFFNFMSSIMQTHNMRTMYETAQILCLQSFVVDLRHICAHGQMLPPLNVLRNTADYCIRWLHDYYWSAQCINMHDVDATCIRVKEKTLADKSATELFGIYDTVLECYFKGAKDIKTAKSCMHGKRFAQLKKFYTDNNLQTLREAFEMIVKELTALVKREVAIKDLPEIFIEAFLKMNYFFSLTELHYKHLASIIEVTQSLFCMLATFGLIEDLFHALLKLAENPIAVGERRRGASFWAKKIVDGFVAFRQCKRLYKAELDENPNNKEFDFYSLNLQFTSKKIKKLLNCAGVDQKRTLLFGDSFRRPWVWVFERDFIENRLQVVNEYTAPVLISLLPLIEPSFDTDEIRTLHELINSLFDANDPTAAVDNSDIQEDEKVYTHVDLLSTLNKCSTNSFNMDITSAETCEKETKFGIWAIVPDDETHNWTTCPLGRLPWE